jgi:hypothetical protein
MRDELRSPVCCSLVDLSFQPAFLPVEDSEGDGKHPEEQCFDVADITLRDGPVYPNRVNIVDS